MQVKNVQTEASQNSPPHTLQASSLRNAARSVKDCCCVDRALRLLRSPRKFLLIAIQFCITLFYCRGLLRP